MEEDHPVVQFVRSHPPDDVDPMVDTEAPNEISRESSMEPSELQSADPTPLGSPLTVGGVYLPEAEPEGLSRAGRKRKANSKYMDDPSPVSKPAPRKTSGGSKKVESTNIRKSVTAKPEPVKAEPVKAEPEPLVTGPPTFGSMLFGKSSRKLSDSVSEDAFLDEDEIPDILSEDEDDTSKVEAAAPLPVIPEAELVVAPVDVAVPGEVKKMTGTYTPSGVCGPTIHGLTRTVLVAPPNEGSISFPDLTSDEYVASLNGGPRFLPLPSELAGGGVLSLLPAAPIGWFRDEIPRLSAYFRKKLESSSGIPKLVVPTPAPAANEPKKPSLTEAQREERRRQKEEERKRLIDERNRRRERDRLKQLYRQHWLALTKFPIEDDLLHSHKGIRRLGHPSVQCRQVASPIIFWDCRLGAPGALEIPTEPNGKSTELLDELFVVWNFFNQFGPHLFAEGKYVSFTLPELVEGIVTRKLTPLMSEIHDALGAVLRPWIEHQLTVLLQAEQALESQLTKNRGRAKMYWSAISQFRDFLFLGYSVFVNKVAAGGPTNWLWESLYVAKAIVLFESIDCKSKEFLNTISTAFEEIDFEHRWIFQWESSNYSYDVVPFATRVKLLKLFIDKIVSLSVVKKVVDLACDGRNHLLAELSVIEKEERKMTQRITLCQKLQAIIESAPEGVETNQIQVPMTEAELAREVAVRDALIRSKKNACKFSDTRLSVRLEVLGRDRHMNEYFQVSWARKLVFVRQHAVSHPHMIRYGVYDSLSNIEALIQSLDERGVREVGLRTELQKVKTAIYSEMVARGDNDFEQTSIDWLGARAVGGDVSVESADAVNDNSVETAPITKYLTDCVDMTQSGFDRIRQAWYGLSGGRDFSADEDDMTVDEYAMDEDSGSGSPEDEQMGDHAVVPARRFVPETESLYESLLSLADELSRGFKANLFAFPRIGETPSTSSSILVQFHIKTGMDLLRQLSIPTDVHEFNKLVSTIPSSEKSMVQITSVFIDGLLALDEVVHDELLRHTESNIEIWAPSGGEKSAWRQFLGINQIAPSTSPGEDDENGENSPEPGEEERPSLTASLFSCETCGKHFRFHILLGIHKLHPCKTRGRKPQPVDPIMEVVPVSDSNGVLAVERVMLPDFPPLPSTRQEAADKAAAAASDPATAVPVPLSATGAPEYICDICGKVFPHNQGLAVHQTRWCIPEQQAQLILTAQQAVGGLPSGPNPDGQGAVNCENCGKLFPTSQGLAIHQTRWCKGDDVKGEGGEVKKAPPKILNSEPVFRTPNVSASDLIKIEDVDRSPGFGESETHREPGFTPACYSLAAVSIATLWYRTRIESAINKFTSEKVHHSRTSHAKGGASKAKK